MCWPGSRTPEAGAAADLPSRLGGPRASEPPWNGLVSLRGMGRWARGHSDRRTQHLPFPRHRIPALETFRTLLCRFAWSLLREALNGWLTAVNAKGGRERRGDLGPIQGNPPEVEAAVRLGRRGHGGWDRPPDVREVPKGHGRLEIRELWLEESAERGLIWRRRMAGPASGLAG